VIRTLAAFDFYTGLGDFLDETQVSVLVEEFLVDSAPDSLSLVLALAVIAVGRHVLESQVQSPESGLSESGEVFGEACFRLRPFLLGCNSLLKLQVSIQYAL
jgi:hypothetical protein